MAEHEPIVASGGFCAPAFLPPPLQRGDIFYVTYSVQGRFRRWWWKRTGWSTEWTVECEHVPITDALPKFTATRGGINF